MCQKFFDNVVGQAVTVNAESHRSLITNFFGAEMDDMDNNDIWFQHSSHSSCHIGYFARAIRRYGLLM